MRGLAPSCERRRELPENVSDAANGRGLGMGFPWARYYDLAHGNPISHTHIERDFGGWFGGAKSLRSALAPMARNS